MKSICVLDCDNAQAWSEISFGMMFKSSLCCAPKQHCLISNIVNENKLPDNLYDFDAVVITGSRFNCRDRNSLLWFEPLCQFIRNSSEIGKPKIYGGCFGCQVISYALGGKVDYNPNKNFILKAETINICKETFSKYLIPIEQSTVNLICSHGDCVLILPPNSELLASSTSCMHEIYITGIHRNILACQGHPEFDLQYCIYDRIWPAVVEKKQRLTQDEIEDAKVSFLNYNAYDAKLMCKVIAGFLFENSIICDLNDQK